MEKDQNITSEGKSNEDVDINTEDQGIQTADISADDQENKAEITTKGSLVAEFEYELKKDFSSLKLHAALLGPAEDIIFSSAPEDSDIDKPLRKGKYKAQVVFPQDLLVSKLYTLKLIMWDQILGEFIHYDVNEKIRFQPIETVSLINNTSGGRSGIIAIKCNCQIN